MGIKLVLKVTNYKPSLAMQVSCDDCGRLLRSEEAIVCWDCDNRGNVEVQKVLCIGKCAGTPGNMAQLPASLLLEDLRIKLENRIQSTTK